MRTLHLNDTVAIVVDVRPNEWSGRGAVAIPAYYYQRWYGCGTLDLVQHLAWQYLAWALLEARRQLGVSTLQWVCLPIGKLAQALGCSEQSIRRHIVRASGKRPHHPFDAFLRVREVESGAYHNLLQEKGLSSPPYPKHPGLCWQPTLVVPIHPSDTVNDVPPQTREVRLLDEGRPASVHTGDTVEAKQIDWEFLAKARGNARDFVRHVVIPLLQSSGNRGAPPALHAADTVRMVETAIEHLGWRRCLDVAHRAASYLGKQSRPDLYILRAIAREVEGFGGMPNRVKEVENKGERPAAESIQGKNRVNGVEVPGISSAALASRPLERDNANRVAQVEKRNNRVAEVESGIAKRATKSTQSSIQKTPMTFRGMEALKIGLLEAWLQDLEARPSPSLARQAIQFVLEQQKSNPQPTMNKLLQRLHDKAREILLAVR